jgi:hypothetical protein
MTSTDNWATGFDGFAAWLADRLTMPQLAEARPDATLQELGLDSLAMMELLVSLDELDVLSDRVAPEPDWTGEEITTMSLGQLYGMYVQEGGA